MDQGAGVPQRPHATPSWRPRAVRERWEQRLVSGLHEEVLAAPGGLPRRGATVWVSGALAVLVHLITVVVLGAAVWAFVLVPARFVGALLGLMLLALAWEVRPRLGRMSDHLDQLVEVGPALRAYLDEIAAAVGTRAPAEVAVSAELNASVTEVGWRRVRVLEIGAPLWAALGPAERTAVLSHELAHFVSGDTRHGRLVGSALVTLEHWYLLGHDEDPVHSAPNGRPSSLGAIVSLGDLFARWVLRVIAVLPLTLWYLLRGVTQRASQRAEYRADLIAARTAGREGALSALRTASRHRSLEVRLRAAAMGQVADLLAVAAAHVPGDPAPEPDAGRSPAFDSHPPTRLRIDAIERLPESGAIVSVSGEAMAAVDAELAAGLQRAEVELRDRYLGSR